MKIKKCDIFSNPACSRGHLDLLDLYRGLAVFAVIIYHYTSRYPDEYMGYLATHARFDYGYFGVNLFFIISGFCICLTITNSKGPLDFLSKRFSRLYPSIMVCTPLTFAVVSYFGLPGRDSDIYDLIVSTLLLNDLGFRYVEGAYWSLLVEVKYYLWFALLYFIVGKRSIWYLTAAFVFGELLSILGNLIGFSEITPLLNGLFLLPHLPWFICGVAIYNLYYIRNDYAPLLHMVIAMMGIAYFNRNDHIALLCSMVAVGMVSLILVYPNVRLPRWLKYFGLISYPLYLVHQNIGIVVIRELMDIVKDPYARMFVAGLLVVIIAHVVHSYVELSYRKVFEQWFIATVNRLIDLVRSALLFSRS
jgi:peptidoglycan/LPS O-acetylase OafA/YrhL